MPIPEDDPLYQHLVMRDPESQYAIVQLHVCDRIVRIPLKHMKVFEELRFTSKNLRGVFTRAFFERLALFDPENIPVIEAVRPAVLRMAHYIEYLWQNCPYLHPILRQLLQEYKFFARIVAPEVMEVAELTVANTNSIQTQTVQPTNEFE